MKRNVDIDLLIDNIDEFRSALILHEEATRLIADGLVEQADLMRRLKSRLRKIRECIDT